MRVLSATEAISPALDRTKSVLFQPFRKGRSWKLAATAYLSAMGILFLPVPLALLFLPWLPPADGMNRLHFALLFVGAIAISTAIMSALFYIGARLEFVLFDIVLFKATFVAPLCNKYGVQVRRWVGLKIALGTLACSAIGIPYIVWLAHWTPPFPGQPGRPMSSEFVGSFALILAIATAWISFFMLCSSLLGDFILPYIALEYATLKESIRRFSELFKTEPRQIIYFALFKVFLAIAGLVLQQIATLVMELVVFVPVGLICFVGWLLLHSLGEIGQVLMTAGAVILELAGMVFVFYFLIGIQGCVITFFQAYGLYFLGGRYPLLGDLLDRSTPQPAFAYPAGFPPTPPQYPPPQPGSPPVA
jgi:hypothetical protein